MNAPERCWPRIGIWGDRSCPELARHVHCRNCPVLGLAANGMRQRDTPPGYLDAQAQAAAQPLALREPQQTAFVFQLGRDWLALDTACVVEVAPSLPIHRVAHRAGLLAGVVNVRGQLLLAVRLAELLEATPAPEATTAQAVRRTVVISHAGDTWAFVADQVEGVRPFAAAQRTAAPVTLSPALAAVTLGTLPWGEGRVVLLDSPPLFELLRQRVAV